MATLKLEPNELRGARKIAQWLNDTIETEGNDRPIYREIAHYIFSDIQDSIDATRDDYTVVDKRGSRGEGEAL